MVYLFRMKKASYLLLTVLFFIPGFSCFARQPGSLKVAGIQFEITADKYSSEEKFFNSIEAEIRGAVDEYGSLDLIVFPEYVGVFFQLIEYRHIWESERSFEAALLKVLGSDSELKRPSDIFLRPKRWEAYLKGWSKLADKYSVGLLAGSCFVEGGTGGLRNRLHLFDSDGSLIYSQDKVFLTEFETEVIGLEPGSLDGAGGVELNGRRVVFTICRDTYSRSWEELYGGAFLWIDIKANGEVYDRAQQRSFLRALPLRMQFTDVDFGMTVCSVGSFLDLFWEGESSLLERRDDGVRFISAAGEYRKPARIYLSTTGR